MDTKPIATAVEAAGGQSALAKAINVAPQMVWQWVNDLRPVPAHHCIPIETATNGQVTRYQLRSDVFGAAPTQDS